VLLKNTLADFEPIKEPLLFTTVVPKFNLCSSQKTACPDERSGSREAVHRFLAPFFGSFLGKQKGTKNILNKRLNQCLFF
jgi:hypothetical protein